MRSRKDIIGVVRDLILLVDNACNENESECALNRAKEMIEKYKITMSELTGEKRPVLENRRRMKIRFVQRPLYVHESLVERRGYVVWR